MSGDPPSCPRCPDTALVPGRGVLHEAVCPSCQGRFLERDSVEQVLVQELGLGRSTLAELAALFGGRPLPCPGCARPTRPVTLRGVPVDLCFACGGLWCDRGELLRLSAGRHEEIEVPFDVEAHVPGAAAAPSLVGPGRGRRMGAGGSAVYLATPDPPDKDVVWKAVGQFAEYAVADLPILVRRACGVLVDTIAREDAEIVASALTAGGERAVVDDVRWLALPLPVSSRRLEVTDAGLVVTDVMNARVTLRWDDIDALGLGAVALTRRAYRPPAADTGDGLRAAWGAFMAGTAGTGDRYAGLFGGGATRERFEQLRSSHTSGEVATVLDVIATDGRRFQVVQGAAVIPLGGAQPGKDRMLAAVGQIAERAPPRARTRGVAALAGRKGPPLYSDGRSYERELGWAMWFHSVGRERFA